MKVVSILLIIFGAISILIPAIGLIGSANEVSLYGGLPDIVIVTLTFIIVAGVFGLIIGIIGLKKCTDPAEGKFYINTGIIFCAISLISMILIVAEVSFDFVVLGIPMITLMAIDLVLSVLFIVGGSMNKKAVPPIA